MNDAASGFDDVEGIDGDVVGAGNDFCAENTKPGDAQGSGKFVEEPGAVPRHDVHHREGAIEIVFPVDDRAQRSDGIGRRDRGEKFVHHLDVQRDLGPFRVDKIAVGQETEMGRDLIIADAGDALGDEFLLGHELLGFVAGGEGGAVI